MLQALRSNSYTNIQFSIVLWYVLILCRVLMYAESNNSYEALKKIDFIVTFLVLLEYAGRVLERRGWNPVVIDPVVTTYHPNT